MDLSRDPRLQHLPVTAGGYPHSLYGDILPSNGAQTTLQPLPLPPLDVPQQSSACHLPMQTLPLALNMSQVPLPSQSPMPITAQIPTFPMMQPQAPYPSHLYGQPLVNTSAMFNYSPFNVQQQLCQQQLYQQQMYFNLSQMGYSSVQQQQMYPYPIMQQIPQMTPSLPKINDTEQSSVDYSDAPAGYAFPSFSYAASVNASPVTITYPQTSMPHYASVSSFPSSVTGQSNLSTPSLSQWQAPYNYSNNSKDTKRQPNTVTTATHSHFSCDACEKDFSRHEQYAAHIKTHVSCSHCSFRAMGSLVKLHEIESHGVRLNGPPKEILTMCVRLDTDEELAKWIIERKKNYPTDTNVQKKIENKLQRQQRGELVENSERNNKGRNKLRHADSTRNGKHSEEKGDRMKEVHAEPSDSEVDMEADAVSSRLPHTSQDQTRVLDSKPDGDNKREKSTRICKYWKRGKCRHGTRCRYRHDPGVKTGRVVKGRATDATGVGSGDLRWKKRTPLLRRLLEREISLEQSHMLQCMRFIAKNACFTQGMIWTGEDQEKSPSQPPQLGAIEGELGINDHSDNSEDQGSSTDGDSEEGSSNSESNDDI